MYESSELHWKHLSTSSSVSSLQSQEGQSGQVQTLHPQQQQSQSPDCILVDARNVVRRDMSFNVGHGLSREEELASGLQSPLSNIQ
ncbi:hypothetical protein N7456_007319 [Penicillium angulare]|uniref:Uncharacterized protein n=1 Tax=Penicillium angulare TaxID=116970 RepID=A0A9W9K855_9EURO|nr:hypothetical protein N7456_007319 [Penicillium angulare]